MKFEAYLVVSFFITCFIYPIAVHWVWGQGFLSAWGAMPDADGKTFPLFSGTETSRGMVDFAGSGCVHMIGGVAGLMGAIMLGPRKGRFVNGKPVTFPPSNQIMMALGTMILWFGWYGFNCGSTLVLSGNAANVAAKVAFTTTISASSGCITMTLIARFFEKYFDIGLALNGILAGLVSITASCAVVNSWHAFIIGMIGAFVVYGASKLLLKLQIDDPLDAFPVHGCCGLWGVIATGIFCTDKNVAYAGYPNGNTCNACSTGEQLGVQIVGALVLFTWSAVTSGAVFLALKLTMGIRVSEQVEDEGMDISEHGACVWVCCFVCIFMPYKSMSLSSSVHTHKRHCNKPAVWPTGVELKVIPLVILVPPLLLLATWRLGFLIFLHEANSCLMNIAMFRTRIVTPVVAVTTVKSPCHLSTVCASSY